MHFLIFNQEKFEKRNEQLLLVFLLENSCVKTYSYKLFWKIYHNAKFDSRLKKEIMLTNKDRIFIFMRSNMILVWLLRTSNPACEETSTKNSKLLLCLGTEFTSLILPFRKNYWFKKFCQVELKNLIKIECNVNSNIRLMFWQPLKLKRWPTDFACTDNW